MGETSVKNQKKSTQKQKTRKKQNLGNVVFQFEFENPFEYAKSCLEFGNERYGHEFYQRRLDARI